MRKLFVAPLMLFLAACGSPDGISRAEAIDELGLERSEGGSSVDTVIALYQSGDYVAAFDAIPEQSLVQRMRKSQAFGGLPTPQGEKAVVEEILCADYDRCDVVTGA
ncbi:hypothetical protein [uncultured Roseobacter sp.]|uniref:hypothetical protein n=1 Tax=uncultured Roseobacter sp. TaxID=114847 RepID=UPI002638885D|nr:hypothetical protein [uncultured Roseobacter sp.]